ncbi:unnamed protein product, partial [Mesorhabditis belari]|uniref:Uncharacterized protein n=1 Tax=Mesorhabditis belari TaxID=2138241 RepID=A0AAF3F2T7_9BILA
MDFPCHECGRVEQLENLRVCLLHKHRSFAELKSLVVCNRCASSTHRNCYDHQTAIQALKEAKYEELGETIQTILRNLSIDVQQFQLLINEKIQKLTQKRDELHEVGVGRAKNLFREIAAEENMTAITTQLENIFNQVHNLIDGQAGKKKSASKLPIETPILSNAPRAVERNLSQMSISNRSESRSSIDQPPPPYSPPDLGFGGIANRPPPREPVSILSNRQPDDEPRASRSSQRRGNDGGRSVPRSASRTRFRIQGKDHTFRDLSPNGSDDESDSASVASGGIEQRINYNYQSEGYKPTKKCNIHSKHIWEVTDLSEQLLDNRYLSFKLQNRTNERMLVKFTRWEPHAKNCGGWVRFDFPSKGIREDRRYYKNSFELGRGETCQIVIDFSKVRTKLDEWAETQDPSLFPFVMMKGLTQLDSQGKFRIAFVTIRCMHTADGWIPYQAFEAPRDHICFEKEFRQEHDC